ncbi:MAG: UPF0158 family protein [Chloroflexota bacterium]
MATKLRKLKLDLDAIADAMGHDPMMQLSSFLDLETGDVVTISEEERIIVERFYEENADFDSDEPLDLAALLAESDYPEWQHEMILLADQIEAEFGKRFIELPEQDAHAGYKDMEAFIATVEDQRLQAHLQRAIEGKGAFRRFKDILSHERRTRERWFAFSSERERERVRVWLEFVGIKAIHTPKYVPEAEPSGPTPRHKLLEEVLRFTLAARQLAGVTRISLIGSLTTDEPDPDDADLLVTISEEMDLEPLATLGRKLSGRAQGFNRGGEVFLADTHGNYLGRTCRWKQCEPFIRMSCEAQNCGQRQYLYDDLQNLRLKKHVIAKPPVELWPQVIMHENVPEDLQQKVLAHL